MGTDRERVLREIREREESAVGSPHAESWRLPEDEGDRAVGAPPLPTLCFWHGRSTACECHAIVRASEQAAPPLDVERLRTAAIHLRFDALLNMLNADVDGVDALASEYARLGSAPSRSDPEPRT